MGWVDGCIGKMCTHGVYRFSLMQVQHEQLQTVRRAQEMPAHAQRVLPFPFLLLSSIGLGDIRCSFTAVIYGL